MNRLYYTEDGIGRWRDYRVFRMLEIAIASHKPHSIATIITPFVWNRLK